MARRFEGKVALITGASSGIGAEVARQLAREGARVVLLARRIEKLTALQEEIAREGGQALAVAADVSDRASLDAAVASAVAAYGGIDIVLANAGFGVSAPVWSLETEDFRRQFDTNFFGMLDTLYASLPALRKSSGRIGLVGSIMGRQGMPAFGPYCASKFAVVGLAESIYHDLREVGVSLTLINPGIVASEIRSVNNEGKYTGKPDPAPAWITVPTPTAAREIINALYRRRAEVVVTGHGKVMLFITRHFPRFTRLALTLASRGRLRQMHEMRRPPA